MQITNKQSRDKLLEKIEKSFLIAGIFLITFIIVNILLSTLLFIFKLSIQKWYAIASLIITTLFSTYLLYKNNLLYFVFPMFWKLLYLILLLSHLHFLLS